MSDQQSSRKYFQLAAVVAIGLALNWMADLFRPSAPIVFFLAVVGLVFMYYAENSQRNIFVLLDMSRESARLIQVALLALLAGAVVAGLWLIPIWPSPEWPVSGGLPGDAWAHVNGPFVVFGYEVGAGLCIAAFGVLGTVRGTALRIVTVYSVAACSGMSLMQVFLRQETQFVPTVVGWSITCVILALVGRTLRGVRQTVAYFLNLPSARANDPTGTQTADASTLAIPVPHAQGADDAEAKTRPAIPDGDGPNDEGVVVVDGGAPAR